MRLSATSSVLAVLAALAAIPAAHAQSTGSCTVRKTEITAANSFDQSTSTTFVNVNTSGSIRFTSTGTGCISGTFAAPASNVTPGDDVRLQVLLDGGTACLPLTGNQGFGGDQSNGGGGTSSADFFCGARVAPGVHTIQVQYHSGNGGPAQIYQRILSVRHD